MSTGACEVMRTNVVVLPWDGTLEKAYRLIYSKDNPKGQHLFPVLGPDGDLKGVVTRNQLVQLHQRAELESQSFRLEEIATKNPRVAYSDEPLRRVVERMADSGFTRFPVLDPAGNGNIVGMVALSDLLRARTKNLEDERARERVLRIRMPFGRGPNERKVPLTKETNFARGIDGLVAGRSVAATGQSQLLSRTRRCEHNRSATRSLRVTRICDVAGSSPGLALRDGAMTGTTISSLS